MDHDENNPLRDVPIADLSAEPEAASLLDTPAMQPYMDLAMAVMSGTDAGPATDAIKALPLEERYVWRVASALKWAFADLETLNVEVDRKTLSPEDQDRLMDLLKLRSLQFCLFLSALLGQEEMERQMNSALRNTRMIAKHNQRS